MKYVLIFALIGFGIWSCDVKPKKSEAQDPISVETVDKPTAESKPEPVIEKKKGIFGKIFGILKWPFKTAKSALGFLNFSLVDVEHTTKCEDRPDKFSGICTLKPKEVNYK